MERWKTGRSNRSDSRNGPRLEYNWFTHTFAANSKRINLVSQFTFWRSLTIICARPSYIFPNGNPGSTVVYDRSWNFQSAKWEKWSNNYAQTTEVNTTTMNLTLTWNSGGMFCRRQSLTHCSKLESRKNLIGTWWKKQGLWRRTWRFQTNIAMRH